MDRIEQLKEFISREPSPTDTEITEFVQQRLKELDDNTEQLLTTDDFNGKYGVFRKDGRI